MTDITVAIDKLDKIGIDAVNSELREKGISDEAISRLQPVIGLKGNAEEKLGIMEGLFSGSEQGLSGISELRTLFSYLSGSELKGVVEFDITLARGLNYYTGAIIEVKSADVPIGSICGGGRYDNLTGVFGLAGVSGVGVSFGADRIYDVMIQLDLFNQTRKSSTDVMVVNFGGQELNYSITIVDKLRNAGIKSELYPDPVKLKKQMSYAGSKNIPLIIIAGEDEIKSNEVTLKIMSSGEQKKVPLNDLDSIIISEL